AVPRKGVIGANGAEEGTMKDGDDTAAIAAFPFVPTVFVLHADAPGAHEELDDQDDQRCQDTAQDGELDLAPSGGLFFRGLIGHGGLSAPTGGVKGVAQAIAEEVKAE